MGDCFIKRSNSYRFITYGITGLFNINSLDIEKSQWINQIENGNNISLFGSFSKVEDEKHQALQISGSGYGEYPIAIQPTTYYVVARAITAGSNWSSFISKKSTINGVGAKYDYLVFFNTNSPIPQPLVCENDVSTTKVTAPCDEYHVICRCNGAFIIDGEIISQPTTINTEYYNNAMELHRIYRNGWVSGSWTANYLFIAFGNTNHTIKQALENSKYLMKKYNIK